MHASKEGTTSVMYATSISYGKNISNSILSQYQDYHDVSRKKITIFY